MWGVTREKPQWVPKRHTHPSSECKSSRESQPIALGSSVAVCYQRLQNEDAFYSLLGKVLQIIICVDLDIYQKHSPPCYRVICNRKK